MRWVPVDPEGTSPAWPFTISPVSSPEQASVELPRPEVTEYNHFVIVPVRGQAEPPGGARGAPGQYRVVFVLGVPGVSSVASDLNVASLEAAGDSLILSEGGAEVDLIASQDQSAWILHSNAQGHLSHAEITLRDSNMGAAEQHAHDQVMVILSRLAFEANTAVEVKATIVTELATGTFSVGAMLVGKLRPLSHTIAGNMNPELSPLLATYRDGLSSTTPLYQALAFYRVTEGVHGFHLKTTRAAAKAGVTAPADPLAASFPGPGDIVTDIDALNPAEYGQFAGMPLREVWESYREPLRNAIAHISPGRDAVVADRLNDVNRCLEAIPVLRYIARQALKAEIARADAGP